MDVHDTLGRPMRDLRVSVTDRCNLRCTYCMPREVFGRDFPFLPRQDLLTYEQIERVVRACVRMGVAKVRLTGGEPLLRRDLHHLVRLLRGIEGLEDLTLTTNGLHLAGHAETLRQAGLDRVTVSLDTLDPAIFRHMSDADADVEQVLAGIDAARRCGLQPIKINAVVRAGVNDHTVVDMARHFHATDCIVRFIEYMDVGNCNQWSMRDVVPAERIVAMIDAQLPLEPIGANYAGEVARRWRYRDGGGEIGVIASVTRPFCRDCTRLRLSPEGRLYTCLFAEAGTDVKAALSTDGDDDLLTRTIQDIWKCREDRYSELRTPTTVEGKRIEMSYIGG